jgi:hypothetical protein
MKLTIIAKIRETHTRFLRPRAASVLSSLKKFHVREKMDFFLVGIGGNQ